VSHKHAITAINQLTEANIISRHEDDTGNRYFAINENFDEWQLLKSRAPDKPVKRKAHLPVGKNNLPLGIENEPVGKYSEPVGKYSEPVGKKAPPPEGTLNIRDDSENRPAEPLLKDKRKKEINKEMIIYNPTPDTPVQKSGNDRPVPEAPDSPVGASAKILPFTPGDFSSSSESETAERNEIVVEASYSDADTPSEVVEYVDTPEATKTPEKASKAQREKRPKKAFEDYPEIAQRAARFWERYEKELYPWRKFDALKTVQATARLRTYYKWQNDDHYEAFFRFLTSEECWHHRNKVVQSFPQVFTSKNGIKKIDKILANFETAVKNSPEYKRNDINERKSIPWLVTGLKNELPPSEQKFFDDTNRVMGGNYFQELLDAAIELERTKA